MNSSKVFVDHLRNLFRHARCECYQEACGNVAPSESDSFTWSLELMFIFVVQMFSIGFRSGEHARWSKRETFFSLKKSFVMPVYSWEPSGPLNKCFFGQRKKAFHLSLSHVWHSLAKSKQACCDVEVDVDFKDVFGFLSSSLADAL